MNKPVLAVIGGGRWGQVILSILEKISLPFDHVVVVSEFNANEVSSKIQDFNTVTSFSLVNSLDNLLAQYNVKAAIIVNSARQHFETAIHLLERGIHVLIEKPVVLSSDHANILINKAKEKEVCLVPGLSYRFCAYLDNFAKQIEQYGKPSRFICKWHDVMGETRHGKLKKHDGSIDVAQDVMPHAWTILSKIFGYSALKVQGCFDEVCNDNANFEVTFNNIVGHIILKRNSTIRERSLLVEFESDKFCKIDFSTEPGKISNNTQVYLADEQWGDKLSPLTQQISYFFSVIQSGKSVEADISACLDSVSCSESASFTLQNVINSH